MFTIHGDGLHPPRIVGNAVPATRVPVHAGDGFVEVHRRYIAMRAAEFGVDANTFGIELVLGPEVEDPEKTRYEITHHHADGGGAHVIHSGPVGDDAWTPGRKAAIGSNIRSAFDNRMWRLRHAQSRLDAIAASGVTGFPTWSFVADEIVQAALAAVDMDMDDMVAGLGTGAFATREMPVKRRRVKDPMRDRHALIEGQPLREALPPMRGTVEAGVIGVERMDLGRGAFYDGHPSGAQLSAPFAGSAPDTLLLGMVGEPIGRVVEHPLIPGHLVITSVRKTERMLQMTVHAPKVPVRLTPMGIGYDVTLR